MTTSTLPQPDASELTRICLVCGKPSDAAECTRCVLDDEIAWKRRDDR